jgi:hypothetical protein
MQLTLRHLVREYRLTSARTATVVICSSPYPADSTDAAALIRPIRVVVGKKKHVGIVLRRLTLMTDWNAQGSWESFCHFLKSAVH